MVTLEDEAARLLPAAISAGRIITWYINYYKKGLSYTDLGRILMGEGKGLGEELL